MKKYFLVLLIFYNFYSHGQQVYHAIPDSNVIWKEYAFWLTWPGPYSVWDDYHLFVDGDTTIGAYTYKKLYRTGNLNQFIYYYNEYHSAFRQDTVLKRVYLFPKNYINEQLLYDFNLNVGDTLPSAYNNLMGGNEVFAIDSVLVGNVYHQRFLLNPLGGPPVQPDTNYAIIEGVGSTFGFYQDIRPNFEGTSLLECFSNDTVHYPTTLTCPLISGLHENSINQLLIIPNPFSKQAMIHFPKYLENGNLFVYDIYGKIIMSISHIHGDSFLFERNNLPNGIYLLRVFEQNQKAFDKKIVIAD